MDSMDQASGYFLQTKLQQDILQEFGFTQPLQEIAESLDLLLEYQQMLVSRDAFPFLLELFEAVVNREEILQFFRPLFAESLFTYNSVNQLFDLKFVPLVFKQKVNFGDELTNFAAAATLLQEKDIGIVLQFVPWTQILGLEEEEREQFQVFLFLQLREICKFFYFFNDKQGQMRELDSLGQKIANFASSPVQQPSAPEFSAPTDKFPSSLPEHDDLAQSIQRSGKININEFNSFLKQRLSARDILMGTKQSQPTGSSASRFFKPSNDFKHITDQQLAQSKFNEKRDEYQLNPDSSSQHTNQFVQQATTTSEASETSQIQKLRQTLKDFQYNPTEKPQVLPPKRATEHRPPLKDRIIEDETAVTELQVNAIQDAPIIDEDIQLAQTQQIQFMQQKKQDIEEISQANIKLQNFNEASDSPVPQQKIKLQSPTQAFLDQSRQNQNIHLVPSQFDSLQQPINIDVPNNFVIPNVPTLESETHQSFNGQGEKKRFSIQKFIADNRESIQLGAQLKNQQKELKIEQLNNQLKLSQQSRFVNVESTQINQDQVDSILRKRKDRILQDKLDFNQNFDIDMDDLLVSLENRAQSKVRHRVDEFNTYRMKVIRQELGMEDDLLEFNSLESIIRYYETLEEKPNAKEFIRQQLSKSRNQTQQKKEMFAKFYKMQDKQEEANKSINPDAIDLSEFLPETVILTNINGNVVNDRVLISIENNNVILKNTNERELASFDLANLSNIIKAGDVIKILLINGTHLQIECSNRDQAERVHCQLKCQVV